MLEIGRVALWTSWKIQQLLIVSHKHNIKQIAEGFPKDVEMYRKTFVFTDAAEPAELARAG